MPLSKQAIEDLSTDLLHDRTELKVEELIFEAGSFPIADQVDLLRYALRQLAK